MSWCQLSPSLSSSDRPSRSSPSLPPRRSFVASGYSESPAASRAALRSRKLRTRVALPFPPLDHTTEGRLGLGSACRATGAEPTDRDHSIAEVMDLRSPAPPRGRSRSARSPVATPLPFAQKRNSDRAVNEGAAARHSGARSDTVAAAKRQIGKPGTKRMSAQVDPSHIMQVGMGFLGSKTLLSAVELELFTKLGGDAMTGRADRRGARSACSRDPGLPRCARRPWAARSRG